MAVIDAQGSIFLPATSWFVEFNMGVGRGGCVHVAFVEIFYTTFSIVNVKW